MRTSLLLLLAAATLASCGLPPDIVGPTTPRDPNAPAEQPPEPAE